ncbi:urease accessory protein UreF [Marimonas arenosa]|uniref:Urease accessory protein UreF n=1 Tax=Marimonas arenosa TaxID=1795305 RepID=A0AAE3WDT5_9RHOB|nr:urease accessory protein UreF [Marimonas arenosa]MDQ2090867.1 urease accessory protein UreF [Marimonas arenosa]
MPTSIGFLTLSQWLSPAYPVGAFAYSHGLEAAVDRGWVRDGEALEHWLEDVLLHGTGRSDALLLAAAFHAATDQDLAEIDATARAFAASRERLLETEQMGAAFCAVTAAVWAADLQGLTYPVALGRAARSEEIPLKLTATIYLQAFLSNLIAAGQRLLPVGQTAAQAMLRRLTPLCADVADETNDGDLERLSGSAFLSDIASMKHETQYSRIFRT